MLGLAAGIGLVVTVSGVAKTESKVLGALYGAGTDVRHRAATRPTSTFPVSGPVHATDRRQPA